MDKCWRTELEKSVVESSCKELSNCCREELVRSVAKELLERSVGEKCWGRVLEKSVVEKCWGEVL